MTIFGLYPIHFRETLQKWRRKIRVSLCWIAGYTDGTNPPLIVTMLSLEETHREKQAISKGPDRDKGVLDSEGMRQHLLDFLIRLRIDLAVHRTFEQLRHPV